MADDDRDWRQASLDLLRAPFAGTGDWWRMTVCTWLGHPTIRPDDPPDAPCVCGWRS